DTTTEYVEKMMDIYKPLLKSGKSVAFVVRKGALSYDEKVVYKNNYSMTREEIIRHIVSYTDNDIIVSTTGKASRELFEIREANGQDHGHDFLTVGSMGHSSSIAMGIAAQKPDKRIWCIDGDGAVLMHMGSMALMGKNKLPNMIHVVINNGAHETVGGMNTVADDIDLTAIAKACGYPGAVCVDGYDELDKALESAKNSDQLSFIEVKCAIGAREDLGRPTTTAKENRMNFMECLDS
ncbi:MAG: phosphonopyruvate decarboxylase, partial [Lachnospiraceae bacterium]|nr:phosphonopyruvate decarboxylase [Lachnospiraceae bacterium]